MNHTTGRPRSYRVQRPNAVIAVLVVGLWTLVPSGSSASNVSYGSGDYWSMTSWARSGWTRSVPLSVQLFTPYNPWSGEGPTWSTPTGKPLPPPGDSGLSGRVWFDANGDKTQNPSDPPIVGAKVWLFRSDSPDLPVAVASSNSSGLYEFTNLPDGHYTLALRYPNAPIGAGQDVFRDVVVQDGLTGTGYDFGQTVAPISKRDFLNSGPDPVPEPNQILLLLSMALSGFLLLWRRVFRLTPPLLV